MKNLHTPTKRSQHPSKSINSAILQTFTKQGTKNRYVKITLETEKFIADYCTTKKKQYLCCRFRVERALNENGRGCSTALDKDGRSTLRVLVR